GTQSGSAIRSLVLLPALGFPGSAPAPPGTELDAEGPANVVACQRRRPFSSLFNHPPELDITGQTDLFDILALASEHGGSRLSTARDQDAVTLRRVNKFAEVGLRFFQTDELHRISSVVLCAGLCRTARILTIPCFSSASPASRPSCLLSTS